MDKIYDFPNRKLIEQEAAAWLIRLDSDEPLQAKELQALKEWMHRSPVHKNELISFGEFWSDQSLVALPISLEDLYYSAPDDQAEPFLLKKSQWAALSSCAAIIVMAVMFGYGFLGEDVAEMESVLYATAVGQQDEISLPDGSKVHLNTNTQIQIDFTSQYRNVHLLQGEAHFDVAKNPESPFRVYAGLSRVQAVGTAFTVYYRDNDNVDVTVTEGKVALGVLTDGSPEQPILADRQSGTLEAKISEYYVAIPVDELGVLEAGQATTILVAQSSEDSLPKLDQVKSIAQQELERRGSWRSGVLVFAGNSLEEVVDEISRYTTLSIEIVDPELKQIRIGGRFSVQNSDALFEALEANFDLRITRLDYNRIEISSAYKNKI